jgi:hypothetical protein
MAEDLVPSEPLSAQFPANKEKYREFCRIWPVQFGFYRCKRLIFVQVLRPIANFRVESSRESSRAYQGIDFPDDGLSTTRPETSCASPNAVSGHGEGLLTLRLVGSTITSESPTTHQ